MAEDRSVAVTERDNAAATVSAVRGGALQVAHFDGSTPLILDCEKSLAPFDRMKPEEIRKQRHDRFLDIGRSL